MEIDMIIGDTSNKDFIDLFFPTLTIAERGELLKILIMPIMLIIKNFFEYFFVNTEDKVLQVFHEIPYTQRYLANAVIQALQK